MFRSKIAFVLIVLVSVVLLPAGTGAAQSLVDPGVDLIILIDESGSMSGLDGSAPTDPEGVRVSTAQYLVDYLFFDGAYVNAERVNRVTVIGFSSPERTRLMVGLTPVENADDVEDVQGGIVTRDGGNTSFIDALRLVRKQFPPATDAEPRQRIIVIITDGGPYDARAERPNNPFSYGDYFAEIRDYYDTQLGADRFPLYVIGVDDASRYWPNVLHHWENVAGANHAIRVLDINEARREIVRVLCSRLNPDQPDDYCNLTDLGPHFIQPYARVVQFSFFKYDPKAKVYLYRPGDFPDKPVQSSDPDVVYKAILKDGNARDEIYEIPNPTVGCWVTARDGTGQVDVFVQVAFHRMKIISPTSAHPQILPLIIELELLDDQGKLVDELPSHPVILDTDLVDQLGNSRAVQMQRMGKGRYATTSPLLLTQSGYYTLTMEGRTTVVASPALNCITSTQTIPIFQRQTFQVFVSEPQFKVLSPAQPYLRYGPITGLAFEFVDPQGNPIYIPRDVPWTMLVSAKAPSGTLVDLPALSWEDGHFRVADPFFLPESGQYELTARLVDQSGAQLSEFFTTFTTQENVGMVP